MPSKSADLTDLFRRANRGDGAAYRQLLTILAPWLRELVRRALIRSRRSPDDCEDIVQEALIAIHVKRHTWDEAQPVEPWARAIATHKLVDFLRRRGSHGHVALDDVVATLPAAPDIDRDRSIDRERLLGGLPEQHRQIVTGIAIEGRSAREVAQSLGTTEGAVRVALHRALKSMGALYRRGSA